MSLANKQIFIMELVVFFLCLFVGTAQANDGCGVFKDINHLPWNVGIHTENQVNDLELACVGTAIKPAYVVTAAHCFCDKSTGKIKINNFYIAFGKLGKSLRDKAGNNLQKVEKQNIFINGHFKGLSTRLNGDIAIVKLQTRLNHEGFTPICIDWENTIPTLANDYKLRHPTWRKGKLIITDVSYIDPEWCQNTASTSFATFVTSDKICAKSDDAMTTEDVESGGGLMYLNIIDNIWYIRGVVSDRDPENQKLVLYSNINIYLNWLSGICAKP